MEQRLWIESVKPSTMLSCGEKRPRRRRLTGLSGLSWALMAVLLLSKPLPSDSAALAKLPHWGFCGIYLKGSVTPFLVSQSQSPDVSDELPSLAKNLSKDE